MSIEAFIAVGATICTGAVGVVYLMIDNRILKQRNHDLEKENDHLREYAKISKP